MINPSNRALQEIIWGYRHQPGEVVKAYFINLRELEDLVNTGTINWNEFLDYSKQLATRNQIALKTAQAKFLKEKEIKEKNQQKNK